MPHKICPACGAEIYFLISTKGNKVPVRAEKILLTDRIAMDNGRDTLFDAKIHEAHFTDCPAADKFRKKKR